MVGLRSLVSRSYLYRLCDIGTMQKEVLVFQKGVLRPAPAEDITGDEVEQRQGPFVKGLEKRVKEVATIPRA